MSSTVLHLTGRSGSGKTTLLEKFRDEHPGSIQIVAPRRMDQIFDIPPAYWRNHAAIAIDEVLQWDQSSLVRGVAELEAYAEKNGKTLILVTQVQNDLEWRGVSLRSVPLTASLDENKNLTFTFDGERLSLSAGSADIPNTSSPTPAAQLKPVTRHRSADIPRIVDGESPKLVAMTTRFGLHVLKVTHYDSFCEESSPCWVTACSDAWSVDPSEIIWWAYADDVQQLIEAQL